MLWGWLEPVEQAQLAYAIGRNLCKEAAPAYNLRGMLYASGPWVLLGVPAGIVRGYFSAMQEPGIELPMDGTRLQNSMVVMSREDTELLGGVDKIVERGKQFGYTLSRLVETEGDGKSDIAKAWFILAHSPELQDLRRSYGLSSLPHDGQHDFRVPVAVRRKGVLGRNELGVSAR